MAKMAKKNNGFVKFPSTPSAYYFKRGAWRKNRELPVGFTLVKNFFGSAARLTLEKELTKGEAEAAAAKFTGGVLPTTLRASMEGRNLNVSFVSGMEDFEVVDYEDFKNCFGKLEAKIVRLLTESLLSG